MLIHIEADLTSLADWHQFAHTTKLPQNKELLDQACREIEQNGFTDPYLGVRMPDHLPLGDNLREGIVAEGVNSRNRALLHVIKEVVDGKESKAKVYSSEFLSPFSSRLQAIFPKFVGSEYLPTYEDKANFPEIRHEDVQDLSFRKSSLDVYLSTDVLEHVPDLDAALADAARVLRKGGWFLGTVPFAAGQEARVKRAAIVDGEIKHFEEPEYHGNPTKPDEGSLVFNIPGWDFISDLRSAGFSRACIRFVMSSKIGSLADGLGGILIFMARK